MARTATGKFVSFVLFSFDTDILQRPQPRLRLVAPMRTLKIVRAPLPQYMRMYSLFLSADVKAKRKPSAYNLFVKEHMKVYLAEHPGKTNRDAMKHVCLPVVSTSLLSHRVFRSARFGKTHRKIQSVARKLRRKLLSSRRKLQHWPPRVRFPRSSLYLHRRMNGRRTHPFFGPSYYFRRFGLFGTLLSISAEAFTLYSKLFCLDAHCTAVVLSRSKPPIFPASSEMRRLSDHQVLRF